MKLIRRNLESAIMEPSLRMSMKPCFRKKHVIAARLGHYQFKASNGWLENFNKRHNIKQFIVSGKVEDVSEKTVKGWHENIYNQANQAKTSHDHFRKVTCIPGTSLIWPKFLGPQVTALDRCHCTTVCYSHIKLLGKSKHFRNCIQSTNQLLLAVVAHYIFQF